MTLPGSSFNSFWLRAFYFTPAHYEICGHLWKCHIDAIRNVLMVQQVSFNVELSFKGPERGLMRDRPFLGYLLIATWQWHALLTQDMTAFCKLFVCHLQPISLLQVAIVHSLLISASAGRSRTWSTCKIMTWLP